MAKKEKELEGGEVNRRKREKAETMRGVNERRMLNVVPVGCNRELRCVEVKPPGPVVMLDCALLVRGLTLLVHLAVCDARCDT